MANRKRKLTFVDRKRRIVYVKLTYLCTLILKVWKLF